MASGDTGIGAVVIHSEPLSLGAGGGAGDMGADGEGDSVKKAPCL